MTCLARHGATLTADEHGGFWLNYAIESIEFGERVIDVFQLSIHWRQGVKEPRCVLPR